MVSRYLESLAELGVGGAHPGGLYITKKLLDQLTIYETTEILDLGCGTGQTMAYIANRYSCPIIGIDSHPVMVNKANQRFKKLGLLIGSIKADAEKLPFETHRFDYVLSESVLAFTNLELSLSEIKRVLKPDGKLVAIEIVVEKDITDKDLEEIMSFYGFTELLTEKDWIDKFKKAGFDRVCLQEFELPDQVDLEHASEFHFSENLDHSSFDVIMEHQNFQSKYADSLGYRIMYCY